MPVIVIENPLFTAGVCVTEPTRLGDALIVSAAAEVTVRHFSPHMCRRGR